MASTCYPIRLSVVRIKMSKGHNGAPLRVSFFGDSICVGQGISIHAGWVTRIAWALDKLARQCSVDLVVTNASSNGSTTRQALERMPYEVQAHGVDILIIQFGLNDCNYWVSDSGLPRVSPNCFVANLHEILARGRRFGARHIFLNNNHPTTRDCEVMSNTSLTFERSNRQYNQLVRDVAAAYSEIVTLNDIERSFHDVTNGDRGSLADLLLCDGLHLSRHGHDVYYETVYGNLEAYVAGYIGGMKQSQLPERKCSAGDCDRESV